MQKSWSTWKASRITVAAPAILVPWYAESGVKDCGWRG